MRLIPPASKMAPMDDIDAQIAKSMQVRRYATPIDRESAPRNLPLAFYRALRQTLP